MTLMQQANDITHKSLTSLDHWSQYSVHSSAVFSQDQEEKSRLRQKTVAC